MRHHRAAVDFPKTQALIPAQSADVLLGHDEAQSLDTQIQGRIDNVLVVQRRIYVRKDWESVKHLSVVLTAGPALLRVRPLESYTNEIISKFD